MEATRHDNAGARLSEATEIYYQQLRRAMESSATENRKKTVFDGRVRESVADHLLDAAERSHITTFSQALTELLALLEFQNEKKTPAVGESAIYNALLRLEKAAKNTSSWELYGDEEEGSLLVITSFEMNMLEQNVSMYIINMLDETASQALFFPLTNLNEPEVIVKWRILEKIASIKLTPEQTLYKLKLAEYLNKRIQEEVRAWLDVEFQKLKLSGKNAVLKDIESLTKSLIDLRACIETAVDVLRNEGALFMEASCSYIDCISKVLDEKLYPVCVELMAAMDTYQECYRTFHVNLRDSCALSHQFYLEIKKLIEFLTTHQSTPQIMKVDYSDLFVKFFMNLLQVIKLECHSRIKRAVEDETKDDVGHEEKFHSSSSLTIICIHTVIDEFKRMEIENEDMQVAFLIKITDIICDGAKIYSEVMEQRLFKQNQEITKSTKEPEGTNMHAQTCVEVRNIALANSVEGVRQYLESLSDRMQWTGILQRLDGESKDSWYSHQILRILNLIHNSMNSQLNNIILKMLDTVVISNILNICEKHLRFWIQGNNLCQGFDRFMSMFCDQVELMHVTLKERLFPHFASRLKSSLLMYIQNNFEEGQPPEYAKTLKENIISLMDYLDSLKTEESDISYKHILQQILSVLDLNSKSTIDLQLDYYSQVAESIVSPVEYLGHIAFQAGYKATGEDTVDLYINIKKGQRLPARKFEMDEIYVKIELCPSFMFPNQVPLKTPSVTEDLDNPVFNQLFQFSNLPSRVLNVKGAVVQALVLNQNKSFSAEAVLLLNQVQNMSGFASIEFLPVYLMPLKKFDMSQIAYQVLENRSKWDKDAKLFISSRNRVSKSQKKFMSCIPGKAICFF